MRKDILSNNEYYHILNKSIANFVIFNDENEFIRAIGLLRFYQNKRPLLKFSQFNQLSLADQDYFLKINIPEKNNKLVEIIAYCLMPTHFHLILQQLQTKGISNYIKNILISYTRYFNLKHNRKGPLWEGRFKNVLIKNDKQLIHLTRYLHLNPVSAGLVKKPENWPASSYEEYMDKIDYKKAICNYKNVIDIHPLKYIKFINDRLSYQRQLSRIKKLLLEQP